MKCKEASLYTCTVLFQHCKHVPSTNGQPNLPVNAAKLEFIRIYSATDYIFNGWLGHLIAYLEYLKGIEFEAMPTRRLATLLWPSGSPPSKSPFSNSACGVEVLPTWQSSVGCHRNQDCLSTAGALTVTWRYTHLRQTREACKPERFYTKFAYPRLLASHSVVPAPLALLERRYE